MLNHRQTLQFLKRKYAVILFIVSVPLLLSVISSAFLIRERIKELPLIKNEKIADWKKVSQILLKITDGGTVENTEMNGAVTRLNSDPLENHPSPYEFREAEKHVVEQLKRINNFASMDNKQEKIIEISRDSLEKLEYLIQETKLRNSKITAKSNDYILYSALISISLGFLAFLALILSLKLFLNPSLEIISSQYGLMKQSTDELKEKNKELQESVLEAKNFRREAEKANISKSLFLANMSHEIRTPMNGVIGMAEILIESELNESQKELVKDIVASGDALLAIINDILDFSKIEAGQMELVKSVFNFRECVENTSKSIIYQAKEQEIDFIKEINIDKSLYVKSDSVKIRQVLVNLLNNAIKFTGQGYIKFSASVVQEEDNQLKACFVVEDSGVGIYKNKLDSIFEKFTQETISTTRRHGGTGLGLGICSELTKLLGGEIYAESEKNKGSQFYFNVPIEKYSGELRKKEQTEKKTLPEGIKVLVVEDNPLNQKLAIRLFENFKCKTDVAQNGKVALEKTSENEYDIIFMDCQMPEMDGYEATGRIRLLGGKYKKIPIIAMTAHALAGDREQCLKVGMNDYLSKPVKKDLIRDILLQYSA